MPGGKNKNRKVEPKEVVDKMAVALMKRELHYFKGLSIMISVLIVLVFFCFAALFSAMYMETRMMRIDYDKILDDITTGTSLSALLPTSDVEPAPSDVVADDWLAFEKYGFKVSFPNSWVFTDKPNEKRIDFNYEGKFQGAARDEGSFYVLWGVKDYTLKNKATLSEKITVAGLESMKYVMPASLGSKTVVVVPFAGKFIQFHFSTSLLDEILKRFELTK